jgi:hypothetical protein
VPGWSSPIGHPIRREVTYCRNHPPALFWDSSNEGVGLLSLADAMASSSPSAVHLLHKAAQLADALFVRNVTPRQFEILKAAAAVDGLSQTAIMTTTAHRPIEHRAPRLKAGTDGSLQCRRTRKYIEHIPSG